MAGTKHPFYFLPCSKQFSFHCLNVRCSRPTGFLNADLQLRMHPSDSRMSDWEPITYDVDSSSASDFPMAIFKEVNNPVTITFTLSSDQTGAATLRVGTTLAFAGGRASVEVSLSFSIFLDAL